MILYSVLLCEIEGLSYYMLSNCLLINGLCCYRNDEALGRHRLRILTAPRINHSDRIVKILFLKNSKAGLEFCSF